MNKNARTNLIILFILILIAGAFSLSLIKSDTIANDYFSITMSESYKHQEILINSLDTPFKVCNLQSKSQKIYFETIADRFPYSADIFEVTTSTTAEPVYYDLCIPYILVNGSAEGNCTRVQNGTIDVSSQVLIPFVKTTLAPSKEQHKNTTANPNTCKDFILRYKVPINSAGEYNITIFDEDGHSLLLDPWWSASWTYKKKIFVNQSNGDSLSNTGLFFSIDLTSLISGGKVKNDCGDIRFVNASENTEWVYNMTRCITSNGNSTFVIYPTDTANSSGEINFYMYYGNAGASTTSGTPTTPTTYENDLAGTFGSGDNSLEPYPLFQTFLINTTGTNTTQILRSVQLTLKKVGSPTQYNIYLTGQNSTGDPDGVILSSGAILGSAITTSYADYNISMSPYVLSKGGKYAILCNASGTNDGSNYWNWAEATSSVYSGGYAMELRPNRDMKFAINSIPTAKNNQFIGTEEANADTTRPYFQVIPDNATITYESGFGVDFNATDETALDNYAINWTTMFSINKTGYLQNTTLIGAGTYIINVTINDTANNLNSTLWKLVINQATNTATLKLNDVANNLSIEYPGQINASATCVSGAVTLFRNSVDKTADNNIYRTIGAGTYNFTASCPVNENYTRVDLIYTATQSKNSTTTLGIAGTTPITYGTITDVVGSNCPSELTCSLNFANAVYGAGTKTFNYSSSGNANYSATSITKDIVINQATSTLTLLLNDVAGNQTSVYLTQTNASAKLGNAEQTLTLYQEGIDITAQNNVLRTLGAGTYNFTSLSSATQNYTALSITRWVLINQATPVLTFLANDGTSNLTLESPQQVNMSARADYGLVSLDKDNANFSINNSVYVMLPVASYIFRANITGDQNYSSVGYSYYNITIRDTTFPSLNITEPINNSNFTSAIVYVNYTTNDINLGSCWFSNNTGITNNTINCGTNITYIPNQGNNTINFWVNDTSNNVNHSVVSFFVDNLYPQINITDPIANNYTSHKTHFNYTFIEINPSTCWYSINEGLTNTTISCGDNVSAITSLEGNNNWTVWINDTSGNINSSKVEFNVDTIPPVIVESHNPSAGMRTQDLPGTGRFEYFITEANRDNVTYTITLPNGTIAVSNTSATWNGNISFSIPLLGTYTLNLTANDTFGNSASYLYYMDIGMISGQAGGVSSILEDASILANSDLGITNPLNQNPVAIIGLIFIGLMIVGGIVGRVKR